MLSLSIISPYFLCNHFAFIFAWLGGEMVGGSCVRTQEEPVDLANGPYSPGSCPHGSQPSSSLVAIVYGSLLNYQKQATALDSLPRELDSELNTIQSVSKLQVKFYCV